MYILCKSHDISNSEIRQCKDNINNITISTKSIYLKCLIHSLGTSF